MPRRRYISEKSPPHRPIAIPQGWFVRQTKARNPRSRLMESTRARIVRGEHAYTGTRSENRTSRATRLCWLMDSNLGDSIRQPQVALHECAYCLPTHRSYRPCMRGGQYADEHEQSAEVCGL